MRNLLVVLISLSVLAGCIEKKTEKLSVIGYVDPFIGTGAHGHTFPGATTPNGMVQLSPDNGTSGWDWCSGYHYSDSSIIGFSHLHLSGTGASDMGDILIMPFNGDYKWDAGSKENPDDGYRSRFSHQNEEAKPGYYSVLLDDSNIKAELTATTRVGIHRYTFTQMSPHFIIDLNHGIHDGVESGYMRMVDKNTVVGKRCSNGWAWNQNVYFAATFSESISKCTYNIDGVVGKDENIAEGKRVKAILGFETQNPEILVRVGISYVSAENALKNLISEAPDYDFENYVAKAQKQWDDALSVIQIEGSDDDKTIFYTALYHSNIAPNTFADVDGTYRGMDDEIKKNNDFMRYHVFSLWDTFRATHPLYTITNPGIVNDFVHTCMSVHRESGLLPVWELTGRETNCMIGYHAVPVLYDAWKKGLVSDLFDTELLEAMVASAMHDDRGRKLLRDYQYIPADKENESVSKALEYAFDDWCIAQMAKEVNKINTFNEFSGRSQFYRNHWDASTGFMRGKLANGQWKKGFDPLFSKHRDDEYTEGNAWQYSWYVPHDVPGLINLHGGKKPFISKLDSLFTLNAGLNGSHASPDISGLIGQYAHGNEPSHHIAYLYNYAGQQYKTSERVNEICNTMYHTGVDGLSGNEDCGQMSSWYVFSSMGFYPVNPANQIYQIGTPRFQKVVIDVPGNKEFIITTEDY
ncbi:MAG: GH92 family glycosyl hydrolase, partial [Carboxylicivirga sp.]|nr:GH92 family glycosyl hydrolase [Carboxylicivirga sp.]